MNVRQSPDDDDAQFAEVLADLFRRVSYTMPPASPSVVDASIAAAIATARERRRGRRQFAGIAASAALVGSIVTGTTMVLAEPGGAGSPSSDIVSTATQFGVSADQMGQTLALLLGQADSPATDASTEAWVAERPGDLPAWISGVESTLGIADAEDRGASTRTGVANLPGGTVSARVSVSVQEPTGSTALVLSRVINEGGESGGMLVERRRAGMLLLLGPVHGRTPASGSTAAAATLVTDDGWVIRVLTSNVDLVPMDTLTMVALSDVWVR